MQKNKEAAYEVLKYLYDDETIQIYLDDQGGIACKDGDFAIPETLKDMRPYIEKITVWQIIRITIIRVR